MPELPEVEVICRGIRPFLLGRKIINIESSGKRLRQPIPLEEMKRTLSGQTIIEVERRAKFLQIKLDQGEMLIIHLGMTGNLGIFPPSQPKAKHDHVLWSLDNDTELRYNDTRRFGSIHLLSRDKVTERETTFFKTTGPEPLGEEFSVEYLEKYSKDKSLAVKLFIMTNQTVAGIGNIYANESLFAAGIRPNKQAREITKDEWTRLVVAIRQVLRRAIECGGSTISDFLNASQERGYFQINFKVYGRENEDCLICSSKIKKEKIGGRASFYCPKCQT